VPNSLQRYESIGPSGSVTRVWLGIEQIAVVGRGAVVLVGDEHDGQQRVVGKKPSFWAGTLADVTTQRAARPTPAGAQSRPARAEGGDARPAPRDAAIEVCVVPLALRKLPAPTGRADARPPLARGRA